MFEKPKETYYTGSGNNLKEFSPYKNTSSSPNQFHIESAIAFTKDILSPTKTEFETHIESQDLHYTKLGKIIGQTYNSYIVVEKDNKIIILDQHALAERIIYERLVKQDKKDNIQKLLIPESIKLSSLELEIILDKKDIFENM